MVGIKPPRVGGGAAVRQQRGPGMNRGLKKPRFGRFPNPDTERPARSTASRGSRSSNDYSKNRGGSYLSRNLGWD
jgi:hypothetical protein